MRDLDDMKNMKKFPDTFLFILPLFLFKKLRRQAVVQRNKVLAIIDTYNTTTGV